MQLESGEESSSTTLYRDTAKKRVGIITMFHESINYGGVLQAYALHKTIQNLGFDCSVIRYSENISAVAINAINRELLEGSSTLEHISKIYDLFIRTTKYIFRTAFKIFVKRTYLDQKISLRKNAFSTFNNAHISSTEPYTAETIAKCVENYDIFVCGSDQIWNPKRFAPVYFLDFVPKNKLKVAYAPSIALNTLTDPEIACMQPLVNRLDAISVREKRGKELVEMLTNKEVHWVLDPTLLLNHDEWTKIIRPYPIKRPYIFCYMLGKKKENKQFVVRVAEKLNMPIVTMPGVANDDFISLTYGDTRVYDAGPGEFLSLIQNAEYVITDSFHGSAFSIIFRKRFFVLKRSDDDNRSSINSRVYNLLEICQLENRLINDVGSFDSANLADEIDYETVFIHLDEKRRQSLEFLIQALHMKPELPDP